MPVKAVVLSKEQGALYLYSCVAVGLGPREAKRLLGKFE
jgi:hypothetical protein